MAVNANESAVIFEQQKAQFASGLHALAEHLRQCATHADAFAQYVSSATYGANGQAVFSIDPSLVPTRGRKRKNKDDDPLGRKRKPKDPLAPKRPASSYILFQNDVRAQLREKHPNMPHSELMTRVSQMWSELPAEKKEVYEKQHAAAKSQYEVKKLQYETTKNGVAVTPVSVGAIADAESDAEPDTPSSGKKEEGSDVGLSEDDEEEEDEEEVAVPPKKKTKPDSTTRKTVVTPVKEKKSKRSKDA